MKRRDFLTELLPQKDSGTVTLPKPGKQEISKFANQTIPELDRTQAGINAYTGTFGNTQLLHLLRRTTFGNSRHDMQLLAGKTMNEAVNILLTAEPNPAFFPINNYNNPNYTDPDVPAGETWINSPFNIDASPYRMQSLKDWWIGMMINQGTSIHEKMTVFWHHHFATEYSALEALFSYKNNKLLRDNALGNYKTLVKKVTLDPAMLQYLNGTYNTKTAPDENYARELQELFTLGKSPDSKYTEDDVKAAARVLTGWRIKYLEVSSYFEPADHDTGDKKFSAFYDHAVINGKTGAVGAAELDELIGIILAKDEVSKHICRKLYRYFVYYIIDASTEKNVIEPLAETFRKNNFNIKPVLEQLFKSDHFYDPINMGCYIKNPLDMCVGLCRQFDIKFPDEANYKDLYSMWDFIWALSTISQMNIGDPPNVAGWPAYWQIPQYHELWINSDTLKTRTWTTDYLLYVGYTKDAATIIIDPISFTEKFNDPSDPNKLIDEATEHLSAIQFTQTQKTFLKAILLSNQSSDYYWTSAWVNYQSDPNDAANKMIVLTRLQAMYKYIMNYAEYHLA